MMFVNSLDNDAKRQNILNKKQDRKNGAINFLKFGFALLIMAYHGRKWMGFENGWIGVEFFFLVSGYYMMQKAESIASGEKITVGETLKISEKYLKKKYVNIMQQALPAFVFAFIVVMCIQRAGLFSIGIMALRAIPQLLLFHMCGLDFADIQGQVWYLSSMLLVMAFIFPLVIIKKDIFQSYLIPVVSALIIGYLAASQKSLNVVSVEGNVLYGNLRALAEILLGCSCYEFAQKRLKNIKASWKLGILELVGYVGVILYAAFIRDAYVGFVLLPLLAISISITGGVKDGW